MALEPLDGTVRAEVILPGALFPSENPYDGDHSDESAYAAAPVAGTTLTFYRRDGNVITSYTGQIPNPSGPLTIETLADTVVGAFVLVETTDAGGTGLLWLFATVIGTPTE